MDKSLPLIIRNAQIQARSEPSLKELLKSTMRELNDIVSPETKIKYIHNLIQDNIGELKTATCKVGCNHCCYHQIRLSKAEGDLLKLSSRFLNQHRLNLQLKKAEVTYEDSACVLLEDGKCSNYENRPIICRLTYVDTEPANCHKDNKTKEIRHLAVSRAAIIAGAYYMLNNELISLPESFRSSQ